MNAITRTVPATLSMPEDQAIKILGDTLYPGAKPESVAMVLSWCRATGRDPMKKPVHIVPMSVKNAQTGKWEWRDVVMPGIGTYRTDAARTGEYVGKTEPEYGPDVIAEVGDVRMTYPKWCKTTVSRLVQGIERKFTATEFWLENYATAGKDTAAPNSMWRKRPYAQLAKCVEAQALRMAFPDETGNTNTMEEMEGKTFDGVTINAPAEPRPAVQQISRPTPPTIDQVLDGDQIPDFDAPAPKQKPAAKTPEEWVTEIEQRFADTHDIGAFNALQQERGHGKGVAALAASHPVLHARYEEARGSALDRIAATDPDANSPLVEHEEAFDAKE